MSHDHRTGAKRRRGATVVEFALAGPILLILFLASVEFSRANVLIHTAQIAASEGARTGIVMGKTAADIRAVVQSELDAVGVRESNILVQPEVLTDATKLITVGVSVPLDERNGYVTPQYFFGDYVFKITAIPRESKNDPGMDTLLSSAKTSMQQELVNAANGIESGSESSGEEGSSDDDGEDDGDGEDG